MEDARKANSLRKLAQELGWKEGSSQVRPPEETQVAEYKVMLSATLAISFIGGLDEDKPVTIAVLYLLKQERWELEKATLSCETRRGRRNDTHFTVKIQQWLTKYSPLERR